MRTKESVVTVNDLTSSEILWSGVGECLGSIQAVVCSVGQIEHHRSPRHKFSPEKGESFLGETDEDGNNRQTREDAEIIKAPVQ
jgi:hypothetical protein